MKIEDFVEFRFLKPKPCLHCSRSFSYLWWSLITIIIIAQTLPEKFNQMRSKLKPPIYWCTEGYLRIQKSTSNKKLVEITSEKVGRGDFLVSPSLFVARACLSPLFNGELSNKKQAISINKIMKWKCFSSQAPTSTRFTPCLYSYEPFSTFSSSESQDQSNGRKPFCCDILFLLVSLWQSCTGKMRWRRGAWQTYVNTIQFRRQVSLKERKKGRKCVDRLHQVQM